MFTVLWDNDGVLVDTEGLYFQACRTVLETIGVELSREQFQEISLRRGESTLNLAEARGLADVEVARLRARRNQIYSDLLQAQSCVVPGAKETLEALYGQVRMGVVTSSRRDHFEIAHARSGLLKYMDFILTHEDYQHSKPHPEPYLTALDRHGLQPEQCLVVEDSPRGLASAIAAGLPCLVVLSGWTRREDFRGACQVLDDIRAVPEYVLRRASLTTPASDRPRQC